MTALPRWRLWVALSASTGLVMLGGMVWWDAITMRQAGGLVVLTVALLIVFDATKEDAPPVAQMLPVVEEPAMIETETMYNYGQEGQKLNRIMTKHGVGFRVVRYLASSH